MGSRALVLFSGGKDSVYALHVAVLQGLAIEALITFLPSSNHPWYVHRPLVEYTALQAELMGLKHAAYPLKARDRNEERNEILQALEGLYESLGYDYIVAGVIASDVQRYLVLEACERTGAKPFMPLWGRDRRRHLMELVESGVEFVITSVNALGIPLELLGKIIGPKEAELLLKRALQFGFDPSFEGGEAETFVVHAPLFSRRICIDFSVRAVSEFEGYLVPRKVEVC